MSAEPPTDPVAPAPSGPAATLSVASQSVAPTGGAPGAPERRGLLIILTAVEFVLLLPPLFLPVVAPPIFVTGDGGTPCPFNGGGFGGPTVVDPCKSVPGSSQALAMIAVLCLLVSVFVLPVVIGALSRRWQTAVALPSAPFWMLTLLLGAIALLARVNASDGSVYSDPVQAYAQVLALLFATPVILVILMAAALGGLGWLTRRGLAR